ncbi:TIM barrel protein [Reichenbachiella sp. MALMAid0571]|uniref:hydroxypyruvate isomerase family protein n=1 Tax=Reichenbachiella sp. MALMAid0571 TaxID=3143939 RepID=UPI0032E02FC0
MLKGNINHSVCRWCYEDIPLEQLCEAANEIGITSIDLLEPEEWKIAQKYGLTCAMPNGSPLMIERGFNNPQLHEQLLKDYTERIPMAADHGLNTIICFSGNRNGLSEKEGLENCAKGLEPVIKLAEKYGIVLSMELLNSKLDHPDYQCDHTEWGVTLAEKLGSENFKLLYDIYHMQIMEGDIIATIQKHHQYINHYHTGGVPGRAEIDEIQELNYPAIMKAILATGYTGFVAQEFVPKGENPIESLRKAVNLCDI